ncbi:hypothetical protein C8R45DRAFT_1065630 [Mycena sanguinolenta]|nr:hypothetical protein C8R45DRAFT_1065630 [Mycena sanguinolenta]
MGPDLSGSRRARKTRGSRNIKDVFTAPKNERIAFRVPKYKTAQAVVDDASQDEEFDFTGVDLARTGTTNAKGKAKEPETPPAAEGRSTKRRKVAHDLDFLETSLPPATQASDSFASQSAFPVPSSDMLKYIHHFACNYYSDRGQLFNESRTWRKGRKDRKCAKLAAKAKLLAEESKGPVPDADLPKTVVPLRRDMYKTMDGSALLAIGMLLQEQIAQILAPKIPDDWEQGNFAESGGEDEEEEEFGENPDGATEDCRGASNSREISASDDNSDEEEHPDEEDGEDVEDDEDSEGMG